MHWLAGLGLAFLFFLAGMEVDPKRISGRPLLLGAGGWGISLALAGTLAALLVRCERGWCGRGHARIYVVITTSFVSRFAFSRG